jgi:hypothetical protein
MLRTLLFKWFTILAAVVATFGSVLLAIVMLTGIASKGPLALAAAPFYLGVVVAMVAGGFCWQIAKRALGLATPGPAALRVARALVSRRRAREWGLSSAELLELSFGKKEEEVVLLGAIAIALDIADFTEAKSLFQRALSIQGTDHDWAWPELWLQGAMFSALLETDAPTARSRFSTALGVGAEKLHGYPKLAEAAVCLAEGQAETARSLLREWQALAAEPTVTDHIRVGNHWALEMLELRLAQPGEAAREH